MANTEVVISARDETAAAFRAITANIKGFEGSLTGVLGPIGGLQGAIASLAATLGVMSFVDSIKGSIEFAAGLKRMSQESGASVESLSQISQIAKVAGVPMDAVGASMVKLAKSMAESTDPTSKAASALKAIGITQAEVAATGGDTGKMYQLLAQHMGAYADGSGKTAVALALLGRAGAAQIPVLNALFDAGDVVVKVTNQQAETAEEYQKTMMRLQLAFSGLSRIIGMEVAPVLLDIAKVLLSAANETAGLKGKAGELAADGSLKRWAQDAALGVAYIVDAFRVVIAVFKVVGDALYTGFSQIVVMVTGAGEAIKLALEGKFREASDVVQGSFRAMKAYGDDWAQKFDSAVSMSSFGNRLQEQFNKSGAAAKAAGDQIQYNGDKMSEAEKAAIKYNEAMDKLLQKLSDQNDKLRLEAEGIEKSKLERALDTVELERQKALREDYNKKIQDQINTYFDERRALVEAKIAGEAYAAAQASMEKALASAGVERAKELLSLDAEIAKQVKANETFGLGKLALLDVAMAELEAQKATAARMGDGPEEQAYYDAKIGKLRELKGAIAIGDELEANKVAQENWKKTWDATIASITGVAKGFITDVIDNGWGTAFKNLFENAKKWFFDLVAEMAAKQIVLNITGSIGMTGAGLANAATGGGGAGGGGGIGDILGAIGSGGNLLSGIGSVFGLGSSAALPIGTALGNIGTILPTLMETGSITAAFAGLAPSFAALIPWAGLAAIAVPLIIKAFDKGDAMRTADWISTPGARPWSGDKFVTTPFGQAGLDGGKWFSDDMNQGLNAMLQTIGAIDTALAQTLGPDLTAAVAQALAGSTNYSFGMEHTDVTQSGAAGAIVANRYAQALDALDQGLGQLVLSFRGTGDELAKFVISLANVYQAAQLMPAGVGDALLTLVETGGMTAAEVGRFAAAYKGLGDALAVDPQQIALTQLAAAHTMTWTAAENLRLGMDALAGTIVDNRDAAAMYETTQALLTAATADGTTAASNQRIAWASLEPKQAAVTTAAGDYQAQLATLDPIQAGMTAAAGDYQAQLAALDPALAGVTAGAADLTLEHTGLTNAIDDGTPVVRSYEQQLQNLEPAHNAVAAATKALRAAQDELSIAQGTNYGKLLESRQALTQLVSTYDGSTASTESLYKATQAYVNAQVQALIEIEKVRIATGQMFADSYKTIEQFFWTNSQRADYLKQEAAKTAALLAVAFDPTQIQNYAALINNDLTKAFQLLSPEEQKLQQAAFLEQIAGTDALVKQRLDASRQEISQDNANAQSVLGDIRSAMDTAAQKLISSASALSSAADKIATAADTNATAAETQKRAADAQQAAASTTIAVAVNVDGNLSQAVSQIQADTVNAVSDGNYWLLNRLDDSGSRG